MKYRLLLLVPLFAAAGLHAQSVYDVSDFGLRPGDGSDAGPVVRRALERIAAENSGGEAAVLRFPAGRYDFYEAGAVEREYYISNHDQPQPRRVGIAVEGFRSLTIDGGGSEFVFHGRMLPVALVGCSDCTLRDLRIDFEVPHIAQVRIVESDPQRGTLFEPAPWVRWRITPDSLFEHGGEGWRVRPAWGIAFDPATRRILYRTGDVECPTHGARAEGEGRVRVPGWYDAQLVQRAELALRGAGRPAPGIFLARDVRTLVERVTVHYAEGMGLLAQLCEDVALEEFGVRLRGGGGPRCFTTQADATHFSGCRGLIRSCGGCYEGMMDDAINVHGTYLKVVGRLDERTLIGRYMHSQTWGFDWGFAGDSVQFVRSRTMDPAGTARIAGIRPHDSDRTGGAREFVIRFEEPVRLAAGEEYGIENLSWTPEVLFSGNTVRNNRARGALFSTPRRTVVEDNLFDHVSGTAILLCGDCNGWFETGACRRVEIRRNRFVNALTSLYQFTEAVISVCPVIPDPEGQQGYFHGGPQGGILIEENRFETFDAPILYARSVDGLVFRRNVIVHNDDFPPFHANRGRFTLERTNRVRIEEEGETKNSRESHDCLLPPEVALQNY